MKKEMYKNIDILNKYNIDSNFLKENEDFFDIINPKKKYKHGFVKDLEEKLIRYEVFKKGMLTDILFYQLYSFKYDGKNTLDEKRIMTITIFDGKMTYDCKEFNLPFLTMAKAFKETGLLEEYNIDLLELIGIASQDKESIFNNITMNRVDYILKLNKKEYNSTNWMRYEYLAYINNNFLKISLDDYKKKLELDDIDLLILDNLIKYIYNGYIKCNKSNLSIINVVEFYKEIDVNLRNKLKKEVITGDISIPMFAKLFELEKEDIIKALIFYNKTNLFIYNEHILKQFIQNGKSYIYKLYIDKITEAIEYNSLDKDIFNRAITACEKDPLLGLKISKKKELEKEDEKYIEDMFNLKKLAFKNKDENTDQIITDFLIEVYNFDKENAKTYLVILNKLYNNGINNKKLDYYQFVLRYFQNSININNFKFFLYFNNKKKIQNKTNDNLLSGFLMLNKKVFFDDMFFNSFDIDQIKRNKKDLIIMDNFKKNKDIITKRLDLNKTYDNFKNITGSLDEKDLIDLLINKKIDISNFLNNYNDFKISIFEKHNKKYIFLSLNDFKYLI